MATCKNLFAMGRLRSSAAPSFYFGTPSICSRSLQIAPFDKPYTTFYWSAIVNIAHLVSFLSCLTLHNVVALKSGEVNQGHGTIRKLGCGLLFAFHRNYGCILHHFGGKARYWSKIVIFHTRLAFDAPFRGFLSE